MHSNMTLLWFNFFPISIYQPYFPLSPLFALIVLCKYLLYILCAGCSLPFFPCTLAEEILYSPLSVLWKAELSYIVQPPEVPRLALVRGQPMGVTGRKSEGRERGWVFLFSPCLNVVLWAVAVPK